MKHRPEDGVSTAPSERRAKITNSPCVNVNPSGAPVEIGIGRQYSTQAYDLARVDRAAHLHFVHQFAVNSQSSRRWMRVAQRRGSGVADGLMLLAADTCRRHAPRACRGRSSKAAARPLTGRYLRG